MCQCVLCDCCWWNVCGVCCAGLHLALCCVSCWLCKPDEMTNQECCQICTFTGCGKNVFFHGMLCCAPDYVISYSQLMNTQGNSIVGPHSGKPTTSAQFKWFIKYYTILPFLYFTIKGDLLALSLSHSHFIFFHLYSIEDGRFYMIMLHASSSTKKRIG